MAKGIVDAKGIIGIPFWHSVEYKACLPLLLRPAVHLCCNSRHPVTEKLLQFLHVIFQLCIRTSSEVSQFYTAIAFHPSVLLTWTGQRVVLYPAIVASNRYRCLQSKILDDVCFSKSIRSISFKAQLHKVCLQVFF